MQSITIAHKYDVSFGATYCAATGQKGYKVNKLRCDTSFLPYLSTIEDLGISLDQVADYPVTHVDPPDGDEVFWVNDRNGKLQWYITLDHCEWLPAYLENHIDDAIAEDASNLNNFEWQYEDDFLASISYERKEIIVSIETLLEKIDLILKFQDAYLERWIESHCLALHSKFKYNEVAIERSKNHIVFTGSIVDPPTIYSNEKDK